MATTNLIWPTASEYMEAMQNPQVCFADQTLRQGKPALDRLGMPVVMSGNFAYVFKLQVSSSARAIKCFRQFLGDREARYLAIDKHLDAHRIPALTQFEYDADGITVGGRRYPVLIMEWVDGNTLDVYIASLIKQQKAKGNLKPLAEQWAELVARLDSSEIAHGDLQHGNVIVTASGLLKLVDLDGMYVPALNGRQTTELGHIHFQHPRRSQAPFDRRLDNFSSLVIYVSLLALDREPKLWDEFHDDNLIFTKKDFIEPSRSKLFSQLATSSGEIARLTDVLLKACAAGSPAATPQLSDLVQVKQSKLPDWMRQPTLVTVQTKSREASAQNQVAPLRQGTVAPQAAAGSTSKPWQGTTSQPVASKGATTVSPTLAPREWLSMGFRQGLKIALYGLLGLFLWLPLLQGAAEGMGAARSDAPVLAVVLYAVICLGIGMFRARSVASARTGQSTTLKTTLAYGQATTFPTRLTGGWKPASQPAVHTTSYPLTVPIPVPTAGSRVVGSSIRLVYHRPGCDWAGKISNRNRTSFNSAQQAAGRGYRPCRVCNP